MRKTAPEPDLLTATLTGSARDFERLEAEWNDLYRHSENATPFQSWGWLFSWWQTYALDPSRKLALLSLRERSSGLLLGVFPMMIKRSLGGVGVLSLIGDGVTDYLDVVVRSGWEREVFEAGARAVQRIPGWTVGDFRQLRPEASVFGALEKLDRRPERLREEGYPRIVAPDWEAAVRGAGKNLRSMARRSVKRLAADGVERVCVPPDTPPGQIADAARRFVALHREYWRDRNISPEHLTGRFANHIVLSAGRMVPEGGMEIREFRLKGEVIASQVIMVGDGYAGQMLSGAGAEAAKRYQLSSLFIYDGFKVSERVGAAGFDLLRGEEAYKLRWNPEVVSGTRAVFGRNDMLRRGYLASVKAYAALREQAHAGDASPGVKRLFAAYTDLRSRFARLRNRG
ncbi:GNAT family N-acetyltransferase [Rubrobacter indicoceani]|uniref:GNAT family N-acetyltransferase n=1 Tax=Rubrobacter indicoceani TaxID=2051957 RepID=UPI0013C3E4A8|nr:GNAT family N-acetyltransferase [Rubrobacter indicoceani]